MQTARASPWGGGGRGMCGVSGPHQVPETCDFNYPGHVTVVLGTPQPQFEKHGKAGPGITKSYWAAKAASGSLQGWHTTFGGKQLP